MEIVFHNWTSVGTKCRNNSKNFKLLFLRISCLKTHGLRKRLRQQTTFWGLVQELYLHKTEHLTSQGYVRQSLSSYVPSNNYDCYLPSLTKLVKIHLQMNISVWIWYSFQKTQWHLHSSSVCRFEEHAFFFFLNRKLMQRKTKKKICCTCSWCT